MSAGQRLPDRSGVLLDSAGAGVLRELLERVSVPMDHHPVRSVHRAVRADALHRDMDVWAALVPDHADPDDSEDCDGAGVVCHCDHAGARDPDSAACEGGYTSRGCPLLGWGTQVQDLRMWQDVAYKV